MSSKGTHRGARLGERVREACEEEEDAGMDLQRWANAEQQAGLDTAGRASKWELPHHGGRSGSTVGPSAGTGVLRGTDGADRAVDGTRVELVEREAERPVHSLPHTSVSAVPRRTSGLLHY